MSAEPSSGNRGSPTEVDLEIGFETSDGTDWAGSVVGTVESTVRSTVGGGLVVTTGGRSTVRLEPVATGCAALHEALRIATTASAAIWPIDRSSPLPCRTASR